METQTRWNWPFLAAMALNFTAWAAIIAAVIVGYGLVA